MLLLRSNKKARKLRLVTRLQNPVRKHILSPSWIFHVQWTERHRPLWKLHAPNTQLLEQKAERNSCSVWASRDSYYKDCYHLRCDIMQFGTRLPTFRTKQRTLLAWIIRRPWKRMKYVSAKCRWTPTRLTWRHVPRGTALQKETEGKCSAEHTKHWSH
jgi:hypothetical protein